MPQKHTVGFSLVELLAVITIMALLAVIILPVFSSMSQGDKTATCMENLREIGAALALYHDDYGAYPPAPRPDFLASGNPDKLPYTPPPYNASQTGAFPMPSGGWSDWQLSPTPPATDPVIPSAPTDQYAPYYAYMPMDSSLINPNDMKTNPNVGNFGLATLYYLFLNDQKDYLRTFRQYHCPLQTGTALVNRGNILNNIDPTLVTSGLKTFDPLWAGYNTYDITYNYNQYQNEILKFDRTVFGCDGNPAGKPFINIKRQLHFGVAAGTAAPPPGATSNYLPRASNDTAIGWNPAVGSSPPTAITSAGMPTDTVVCWCYAHIGNGSPAVTTIDQSEEATDITATAVQQTRAAQVYLVLWADGTVKAMHPYLIKSTVENKNPSNQSGYYYYWVPPFLYSQEAP